MNSLTTGESVHLRKIPSSDKIGYGMGNLTYGIILQMIGTYVVFYATAVLGISGSLVGIAVSVSVFWDAFSDPFMGFISDITRLKHFGRRHLYILSGTVLLALFNYLLWSIQPDLSPTLKFAAVFLGLILVRTAATIFITPYTALGSELSMDYNERTSIQGIRTVFFLFGLMFATLSGFLIFFHPTQAYPVGQLNPVAYRNMGLATSITALVFGLICFLKTHKYIKLLPVLKRVSKSRRWGRDIGGVFTNFLGTMKNRNYRLVVFAYMLTNISTALISSLGIHVFTYTFGLNNLQIGLLFGLLFLSSILSQPLWVIVSRKIDKKPTIIIGLLLSILGSSVFFIFVLLREMLAGQILLLLPFSIVMGIGSGALFSLPFSMVADTLDVDELKTGVRLEGVYYGNMTFFYKLSQSVVILFVGVLIDLVRFNPNASIQPSGTVMILGMTISAGSFLAFLLAFISYSMYDLNKEKVLSIQREIEQSETKLEII
jgi:glycoside/pentoside/hexuronide:cation symporter, GPH family